MKIYKSHQKGSPLCLLHPLMWAMECIEHFYLCEQVPFLPNSSWGENPKKQNSPILTRSMLYYSPSIMASPNILFSCRLWWDTTCWNKSSHVESHCKYTQGEGKANSQLEYLLDKCQGINLNCKTKLLDTRNQKFQS